MTERNHASQSYGVPPFSFEVICGRKFSMTQTSSVSRSLDLNKTCFPSGCMFTIFIPGIERLVLLTLPV